VLAADPYVVVKALHIVSATILFGTGVGTAFFFWSSRHADDAARLFAARTTVRADFMFTLPAVIIQPLTGAWLMVRTGVQWTEPWIAASLAFYAIAGLCWLPVIWLQISMKRMLEQKLEGEAFDAFKFERLRRTWFWLGWPAFGALIAVFLLMVAKPA
jgi:uncharacterized membrane protein